MCSRAWPSTTSRTNSDLSVAIGRRVSMYIVQTHSKSVVQPNRWFMLLQMSCMLSRIIFWEQPGRLGFSDFSFVA